MSEGAGALSTEKVIVHCSQTQIIDAITIEELEEEIKTIHQPIFCIGICY